MPTLHLMIGLPCSGKTTYAKALAERERALRFTPDEWHLRLFGDDAESDAHDRRHTEIERIMWDVASDALRLGVNVVLDFGLWAREERDDFKRRAAELGAECRLHYMDVSRDELFRRLHERNRNPPPGAFVIPNEYMESYIRVFQPPGEDELSPHETTKQT